MNKDVTLAKFFTIKSRTSLSSADDDTPSKEKPQDTKIETATELSVSSEEIKYEDFLKQLRESKESSDKVTDKVTGQVIDHVTVQATDKVSDRVTDPVTDDVTLQVTDHVTDQATDKMSDRVTDPVTDRVTDHVTDKVSDEVVLAHERDELDEKCQVSGKFTANKEASNKEKASNKEEEQELAEEVKESSTGTRNKTSPGQHSTTSTTQDSALSQTDDGVKEAKRGSLAHYFTISISSKHKTLVNEEAKRDGSAPTLSTASDEQKTRDTIKTNYSETDEKPGKNKKTMETSQSKPTFSDNVDANASGVHNGQPLLEPSNGDKQTFERNSSVSKPLSSGEDSMVTETISESVTNDLEVSCASSEANLVDSGIGVGCSPSSSQTSTQSTSKTRRSLREVRSRLKQKQLIQETNKPEVGSSDLVLKSSTRRRSSRRSNEKSNDAASLVVTEQEDLRLSNDIHVSQPVEDIVKCDAIINSQPSSNNDSPSSSQTTSQGSGTRRSLREVRNRLKQKAAIKAEEKSVINSVEDAGVTSISRKEKKQIEATSESSNTIATRGKRKCRDKVEDTETHPRSREPVLHGHGIQTRKAKKCKLSVADDTEERGAMGVTPEGLRSRPLVVDIGISSPEDDSDCTATRGSPMSKRKRRGKSAASLRKKHRTESPDKNTDDDVILVTQVSSPSSALREERLARLHAMSTPDDDANLRQVTKAITPTQAELFPRISHVTQLPKDEEDYQCRLNLLPESDVNQPDGREMESKCDRLYIDVSRSAPVPHHSVEKSKLSNSRIKKELKKLSSFLPHYPVQDVYDSLDSRETPGDVGEQLWTHKYSPTSFSQLLVGKGCVEVINEWLLNWKRDIINGQASINRKRKKKKNKRKRDSFIDDNESDESDTEWTQTPLLVISGGSGLSKTTCAYTIATLLGYKVFEINPSMLRTTKTVMEKVHESTQSQQVQKGKGISIEKMFDSMVQAESKPVANGITSFFTKIKERKLEKEKAKKQKDNSEEKGKPKSKGKPETTTDESEEEKEESAESVSLSKLSLILFDEADVVFEDDKGFYESIRTLGLQAKKPLIMTCQSTDLLRTLGVQYSHVEITPYSNSEIAAYLCLISLVEQEVADFQAMLALVNKYKCDVRRCILHVQYLVSSGGLQCNSGEQHKVKPKRKGKDLSSPLHDLARISHYQTSLDVINRHNCTQYNTNYSTSRLSSNKSRVTIEKGMQTSVTSDPVLWSSVYQYKSVYTELLKQSFSLPPSKSSMASLDIPPSPLVMSIREELPPYSVDISDTALSLDLLPFIQTVCRTEEERKGLKISRRFLHYMDKIGLYVSEEDKSKVFRIFPCAEQKQEAMPTLPQGEATPVDSGKTLNVEKTTPTT